MDISNTSEYIASRHVQIGDVVMLYQSPKKIFAVKITEYERFHNQFGHFHHMDMIGLEYGSKILPRGCDRGWLVILRFSPQLWTFSLKKRTQILFSTDISMILQGLCVLPGKIVMEAGTGSANLSMAFINTIRPIGHLFTFEFNINRVNDAQNDFLSTKVNKFVTLQHRDVCELGLPSIKGGVDAIFLDLPTPWCVIDSACQVLRPGGRICCFSPCLEQVHRTCLSLRKNGFNDIRTIECLERQHEVITERLIRPPLSGFTLKRNNQSIRNTKPTKTNKRHKHAVGNQDKVTPESQNEDEEKKEKPNQCKQISAEKKQKQNSEISKDKQMRDIHNLWSTRTHRMMRGHTGYLTFAVNSTHK